MECQERKATKKKTTIKQKMESGLSRVAVEISEDHHILTTFLVPGHGPRETLTWEDFLALTEPSGGDQDTDDDHEQSQEDHPAPRPSSVEQPSTPETHESSDESISSCGAEAGSDDSRFRSSSSPSVESVPGLDDEEETIRLLHEAGSSDADHMSDMFEAWATAGWAREQRKRAGADPDENIVFGLRDAVERAERGMVDGAERDVVHGLVWEAILVYEVCYEAYHGHTPLLGPYGDKLMDMIESMPP